MDPVELAELAEDGVWPSPAATPAIPMRAGVDVTGDGVAVADGADGAVAAVDAGAAALVLALLEAVARESGGAEPPGGLMNARGALGGLNVAELDGEGGMRPA